MTNPIQPPPLTLESAIKHLQEIVDSKPEGFRYRAEDVSFNSFDLPYRRPYAPNCLYVESVEPNGSLVPSCIAAHLFVRMGVPLNKIGLQEGNGAGDVARVLGLIDANSHDVARLLREVQGHQDEGYTWAEALGMAKASIGTP